MNFMHIFLIIVSVYQQNIPPNFAFWASKNLVDLQHKPSPNRRNQPKAMARAIRIFLALDLLPEMDFFVSPNIYDARLSFIF